MTWMYMCVCVCVHLPVVEELTQCALRAGGSSKGCAGGHWRGLCVTRYIPWCRITGRFQGVIVDPVVSCIITAVVSFD